MSSSRLLWFKKLLVNNKGQPGYCVPSEIVSDVEVEKRKTRALWVLCQTSGDKKKKNEEISDEQSDG